MTDKNLINKLASSELIHSSDDLPRKTGDIGKNQPEDTEPEDKVSAKTSGSMSSSTSQSIHSPQVDKSNENLINLHKPEDTLRGSGTSQSCADPNCGHEEFVHTYLKKGKSYRGKCSVCKCKKFIPMEDVCPKGIENCSYLLCPKNKKEQKGCGETIKKQLDRYFKPKEKKGCAKCGHAQGSHTKSRGSTKGTYLHCRIRNCQCEKFIPMEDVPLSKEMGQNRKEQKGCGKYFEFRDADGFLCSSLCKTTTKLCPACSTANAFRHAKSNKEIGK